MVKTRKEQMDAILAQGGDGQYRVEVECVDEKAAKNLRFALYNYMKEPIYRLVVYGNTLSLIPHKDPVKVIKRVEERP